MEHYAKYLKMVQSSIGNTTTTDTTLNKLGKTLFSHEWSGVFPSDKVKMVGRYGIVNFDDSTEAGSHWIAIVKISGKYIFYDSFGRAGWDNDREQSVDESNCGQRCIAWLILVHIHGLQLGLTI